ncbi:MAG: hypothetical protein KGI29_06325 [Pseudomonadota bacterium]|nr:hypothetical protein [Pseudomonadota bacterium]MDE3038566.1 hypothetical protein [Pseudomonadota bacterium]
MIAMRKGWCPTLARPMESGDGWLARLNVPAGKINADIARAVARLSAQYGNGQIDLTSRGNLQIRGVTTEGYEALLRALSEHGLTDEPRPPRPGEPKNLPSLGFIAADGESGALTLGLLFGRITADALLWLADKADGLADGIITLSPWRTMRLHGVAAASADALLAEAERVGFIIHTHDARRSIEACPGAPACKSAQGETRSLALAIAGALPNVAQTIHVSGCAKGCACPRKTEVVITAGNGLYDVAFGAMAGAAPIHTSLTQQAAIALLTRVEVT